jgi:hypothetical protein
MPRRHQETDKHYSTTGWTITEYELSIQQHNLVVTVRADSHSLVCCIADQPQFQ